MGLMAPETGMLTRVVCWTATVPNFETRTTFTVLAPSKLDTVSSTAPPARSLSLRIDSMVTITCAVNMTHLH